MWMMDKAIVVKILNETYGKRPQGPASLFTCLSESNENHQIDDKGIFDFHTSWAIGFLTYL